MKITHGVSNSVSIYPLVCKQAVSFPHQCPWLPLWPFLQFSLCQRSQGLGVTCVQGHLVAREHT